MSRNAIKRLVERTGKVGGEVFVGESSGDVRAGGLFAGKGGKDFAIVQKGQSSSDGGCPGSKSNAMMVRGT
jgi:hypothetical protein